MPYQTLTLTGGVNTNETAALNQAGISSSQLVRFKPDPSGAVLVEKLGGWAKFFATQVTSVIRALCAWQDTNANKWLAFGTSSTSAAQLTVVQCLTNQSGMTTASGPAYTITPTYLSAPVPVNFQTTAGSSTVTVTDTSVTGLSAYDSVFISTPVSVGGLVLQGQYQIALETASDIYTINAVNVLGSPAYAAYSTVAAPLAVTAGTYTVGPPATLTLTYASQSTAPFPARGNVNITGVNPATWNGSGIVTLCTTTQVTLLAPPGASGSWVSGGLVSNYGVVPIGVTNGSANVTVILPDHGYTVGSTFPLLNESNVDSLSLYGNYIVTSVPNSYEFKISTSSSASGSTTSYLAGLSITGGASSTSSVTLSLDGDTFSRPITVVTGGSSSTSAVTLTWTIPYTFVVGNSISVSGILPLAWNGTYIVTGSTSTSVTYALSGSALSWASGGTVQNTSFNINAPIQVSGANPSAWNGNYTVTAATPDTVTYALSGSALSWVSGGVVSDIGGDAHVVYSITPGPLTSYSGWGVGGYGAGGWGTGITPTQTNGVPIFASNWSLDNWGEILVALPVGFSGVEYPDTNLAYSPIYVWDPTSPQPTAQVLSAGPTASTGAFVAMPQRQIVAWGTTVNGIIDPLLIRWCDVGNFNVWAGQIINQAGSYRLATGSAIIGAIQTNSQGMIWTNIGLWSMQYIGLPYVYSFNQIGQGCGLIARHAVGVMNGIIYWMGSRQFFVYNANGVQPIICPVWDAIFQQLDQGNLDKITIAVNALFEEVTWYYPIIGGNGECSNYVRFSLLTNMWDLGVLARTAWIDNSVLGPPIGYDPVNQYIYQHEISPDADGVAMASSFTTGYFAIAEGQYKAFIDEVWPDFKWGYYNQSQTSLLTIVFNGTDYPGDAPTVYGTHKVIQGTEWFNPRIRTRLLSITISSNDLGSFWRTGAFRYRFQIDGRY